MAQPANILNPVSYAKLCNDLNAKLASNESDEDEDNEREGVVLEVSEH